tara:strand:- start:6333 stop:6563 length:231 start_codon:yes stop_codon:yes gene_type:complete
MASYKTPNGTIVEESVLREKYGSRFDELVSNGTFTLEEEKVVKKKRVRFSCSGGSYGIYYRRENSIYFIGLLRGGG